MSNYERLFEHAWIFQTLQIPFVCFLIILFFIAPGGNNPKMELAGIKVPNLHKVGIAFCFNLVYLSLHLSSPPKPSPGSAIDAFVLLFDIAASFLLIIAAVQYRFQRILSRRSKKVRQQALKRYKIVAILITLITLVIFFENLKPIIRPNNEPSGFSFSLYSYDFFAFVIAAFYLYEVTDVNRPLVKKYLSKYFILGGFLLWALLHPVTYFLKSDPSYFELVGFGGSLVAKACILYGFLSFFINVSRDEILRRNKNLESTTRNLTDLQAFINRIAECSDPKELEEVAITQLLHSDLFVYDYIRLYRADFSRHKLIYRDAAKKNENVLIPAALENQEDLLLQDNAIASYALGRRSPSFLLDSDSQSFYGETGLSWIFVPLMKISKAERAILSTRYQETDTEEKMVGMIQLGFRYDGNPQFFQKSYTGREAIALLELYGSNFALFYDKLIQNELREERQAMIGEAVRRSGDDERAFLSVLFRELCRKMEVMQASFSLYSFDPEKDDRDKIVYTATPDKFDYPYTLEIPVNFGEIKIGALCLWHDSENFFTADNIAFFKEICSGLGSHYFEKKFHRAITELSASEFMTVEDADNIRFIIMVIQGYFGTGLVSIWLLDKVGGTQFRPAYKSQQLDNLYEPFKNKQAEVRRDEYPFYRVIDLANEKQNPFAEFCHRNKIKTLISVPMEIDNQLYGFINIYSRRAGIWLFPEDDAFLKLIANKCTITLITSDMVKSFANISQSLTERGQSNVLQDIADVAQKALHSDPVVLFLLDNHEVLYEKSIHSGKVRDQAKMLEGRKGNFIDISLALGEDKFYPKESDLPKQYNIDNFWRREGIKSMAAILLRHNQKYVGIMFFNYRQQREFPPLIRQLAKAFASFATTAILNVKNIEIIIRQREELAKKAEKIEFEHADVLDKMEKMLPVAAAKSLAEIVRAVNHDIRNHLLKISQSLTDITGGDTARVALSRERLLTLAAVIKADINNSTNLIELFEPDSFHIAVEDVFAIINAVAKLFYEQGLKKEKIIQVSTQQLAKDIPDMRCVKAEISMIIYNLITNARNAIIEKWEKARTSGKDCIGHILISLGYDTKERCYLIDVEDDGIGIDNENLYKIYDVGFTTRTKDKGLGIGLYFISETVATVYGGTIRCTSMVNRGTKFELKLKQHS